MRLIDADKLMENKFKNDISYNAFCNLVKRQPSIDAVPVRCGECKHYCQTKRGQFVYFEECILDKLQNPREDDFCSYGERKES